MTAVSDQVPVLFRPPLSQGASSSWKTYFRMPALEREALFKVRILFKSTGSAGLRCIKKESVAEKFPDGLRNLRRAHDVTGCFSFSVSFLSISNSCSTGSGLLDTCKLTSGINSKIGLFRSSSCGSSELRTVGSDRRMRRECEYCHQLFCPDHLISLQSRFMISILRVLVVLGSLNSFCPVSCTKLNMENLKEMSGSESTTKKSTTIGEIFSQPLESKHMTEDVNQKDTFTNQDSFPANSFIGDKVNAELKQEMKSEQDLGHETCTLETSGGVPELPKQQERHQITDTETIECFQNTENEKDSDVHCDDESFGLETLFEEGLHRSDAVTWTSQSKPKTKQRKQEKRKRKLQLRALSDDDERDMANASDSKDDGLLLIGKKKPKRITPNYFLAIRVSSPQIHSVIKIVQDSITTHNDKLTPALVSLATLHLTLMVIHLESDEQIQKATEVLNQCKISLDPILRNDALTLTFSGLDHFNHQVLYVKLCEGEENEVLKSVVNTVRETFTKEGIPCTDPREFSPHLTVMKLSRSPALRRKGIKKIPAESYASWVDMSFGEESVNALHLCSMNEKKEKDGFYKCVATVTFDDAADEPSPKEAANTRGEGDAAQENDTGDAEQEATRTISASCDKDTGKTEENIEENAPCDEDLSKELGMWTVDDSIDDAVVNKETTELQVEGNGRKSDY